MKCKMCQCDEGIANAPDGTFQHALLSTCVQHLGQKLAELSGRRENAATKAEKREQQLGNLLARIHRDGGHYIDAYGWQRACEDADIIVTTWMSRLEAMEAERDAAF